MAATCLSVQDDVEKVREDLGTLGETVGYLAQAVRDIRVELVQLHRQIRDLKGEQPDGDASSTGVAVGDASASSTAVAVAVPVTFTASM